MLGLTLEGGGAKGAYQIGAWKAFKELNIEFQGITGTSVGALNGALMMQEDFDLAYEIWSNMTPTDVMDIDDKIYEILSDYQLSLDNISAIFEQIKKIIMGFGIDVKPLEDLIKSNVQESKIRQSPKDFGFVTVCYSKFKPLQLYKEEIPEGKMVDYLLASSYLPIFKTKKLDGEKFLDGGFYNNLPVDMLYDKGYRNIVAVRLLSKGRIKKIDYEDLNLKIIQPYKDLGSVVDFTKERAATNIKLGYYDTIRAFKNLQGHNYYLEGKVDELQGLKFLMNLRAEVIKKLGHLFNFPQSLPLNRLLLEKIIPQWIHLLNLEEGATYEDVVIGLLEEAANYRNIDCFAIYSIKDLVGLIKKRNEKNHKKEEGLKERLTNNEFLIRFNKERQLTESIKILLAYDCLDEL